MHYCSHCGQEIDPGDQQCKRCGKTVAYLADVPVFPVIPGKKNTSRISSGWKRWFVYYLVACFLVFIGSYFFFSSPSLQNWFSLAKKSEAPAPAVTPAETPSQPSVTTLKNAYNRLSAGTQKAVSLAEEYRKAGVPGDPVRTAANYRRISQTADTLLADAVLPPDSPTEVNVIAAPLKESIGLIGKAGSIMADYLEGKLSLSPPNPDWVARAQDYFAQSQARLKETQQMLATLRKKFE